MVGFSQKMLSTVRCGVVALWRAGFTANILEHHFSQKKNMTTIYTTI